MTRTQIHFIQSLARGLAVLQAFSADRAEMTLTEIAAATGMNMAATQRFTDTLMQLGFLRRDQAKKFFLGPEVLTLGFSFLNGSQLHRQADRYIKDFSVTHNKTTNLSILDGDEIVFICRHESQLFMSFDIHPGSRLPAHCSAQGKVLLAALDDDALRALFRTMNLKKFTQNTITDLDQLWDDLMETRRRGYSVNNRELSMDLITLGVPVVDTNHEVVAAANVALSIGEAEGAFLQEMIENLLALGAELSTSMGYTGAYPFIRHMNQAGEQP